MKNKLEDLAIMGGRPVFRRELYVGCPNIPKRSALLAMIKRILKTRRLTNRGPFLQEFENKIKNVIGIKHCIAMCNGTVALEIASRALDLKGEVIIPSFTFPATAHALQWQNIRPVFCDIDPKTYTIDPEKIEKLITPNTSAILGVHLFGRSCDIEHLSSIAKRHKLKLIFDAAHSFNCSYKGRIIGQFGDAEILSFHATKFINTFEGGAVVTNDDRLAEKMRLMQNFGFSGRDNVIYLGINGKMSEISAAMGIASLENMDRFIEANKENYLLYKKRLSGVSGISIMHYDPGEQNNYQYVIIEVDKDTTGIDRDSLMKVLHAENVQARRYFYPGCHRIEPYKSYYPNAGLALPVTENISERVLSLPTGTAVKPKDIFKVCDIIRFILDNSDNIAKNIKMKGSKWMKKTAS
jgi:dTDP-4-amino-4,6-dideoxygalactose transaminase